MSVRTPLGIFWDIENCCIPRNKSVSSVVKHIRDFIGDKHPECGYAKEFSCACDVYTLGKNTTESLDKNGVIVVHVNNTAKNAAEDKLQELIDMYVDKYGTTGSAVLCIISSDINLAKQIRNGRRKDLNVILIHNKSCSSDLKNLANESYLYEFVIKDALNITKNDNQIKGGYLEVSNLPLNKHFEAIKSRLSKLSENCGGKPDNIFNGKAFIRFGCREDAERCLQRINGSDVYGSKIVVKLCVEDMTSNIQMNRSLSQQNLAQNLDKTRNKSLSQMNLALNPNRTRNRSKSRTNFTQIPTPGQSSTSDDQKSVLKGFFTRSNEDYKQVVKNLVSSWNDPYIKPDLIQDVQRSLKYGKGEGKHTLFIEAVDANANRTLIKGSKIYLKAMEGVQWNPYVPISNLKVSECKSIIKGMVIQKGQNISETVRRIVFQWNDSQVLPNFVQSVERGQTSKDGKTMLIVTATSPQNSKALIFGAKRHLRSEDGIKWVYYNSKPSNNELKASGSSAQTLSPNSVAKNTKIGIPSNISSLMSVIKGLETKKEDNVSKIVRKIVHNWNDREVNPNFIQNVERDRKCSDKDGDVLLFVTATNPKYCKALVSAANKYWSLPNDPKWTHYYRKRDLSINTDNESIISDFDVISSQFSSTQDLTKCSSLQNLDDIPVISDDFKSVILGFETKKGQNFAKPVRKLVMSWNDKLVQGNFITSVDRFPDFSDEDGKIPLLVTATSPQTCVALVSGAEKYLNSIDGIVWTHFNSGNQLIDFKSDKKPQEVNQSIYENKDNFGSASSVVYQYPRIEPYVPKPLPRNLKISSEVLEQNINNKKEEISVTNDFIKSVKSVVNGFENLFKSSKTPSPTKPSISTKPSTVIPNPIYRPTVPFLYDIGNRMTSGFIVCFSGSLNPSLNNFYIEFLANTDIAFNFNVRVSQSEVVLNSRYNGEWGPEERHNQNFPFIFGHIFDAMIKIDEKQYIIAIKGQHFCNFEHRLPMKSVTQLSIFGDITIHWLRFDNH